MVPDARHDARPEWDCGTMMGDRLGRPRQMAKTVMMEPELSQAEATITRDNAPAPAVQRHSRRLSDKILVAFHHACDQADFEVAEQLLQILEMMLTRRPVTQDGTRRRNMESLVAAHERLWHLRHPASD